MVRIEDGRRSAHIQGLWCLLGLNFYIDLDLQKNNIYQTEFVSRMDTNLVFSVNFLVRLTGFIKRMSAGRMYPEYRSDLQTSYSVYSRFVYLLDFRFADYVSNTIRRSTRSLIFADISTCSSHSLDRIRMTFSPTSSIIRG